LQKLPVPEILSVPAEQSGRAPQPLVWHQKTGFSLFQVSRPRMLLLTQPIEWPKQNY